MEHYKTITELRRSSNMPAPEHPMISMFTCDELKSCTVGNREFTTDFYLIAFKKIKAGHILYGRTKYDHENGSMIFSKPRQVIEISNIELEERGFMLYVHEDFLNGHPLHSEIKKYGFFDYEANEALHLSEREEQIIWDLFTRIQTEHYNNTDEYSRDIMLTHLDSMLKYSQRFYKRQFINRTQLSGTTVSRFNESLASYFGQGNFQERGLPSVKLMADMLKTSPRYLSDLLKQETGKTAIELIHIFLVSEAKNMLHSTDKTVAETAYLLGFENPPYFSRLFKKETGYTPNEYKKRLDFALQGGVA
ncbi:AraC family transcriptional regulator [Dyadobacter beijingensis]|uniref:AraC family transcriptional regulator n=1 Tax=Dyadobacter beijingensis TaxID=365489 RepID=A0ABQ2HYI8_9BACT|nr:helix-turn-helix domain-containing protein [Dyadobacter beijingensis]GGM93715.1 AraC family transcriptional regulator [Dyadobacter beijingensis]